MCAPYFDQARTFFCALHLGQYKGPSASSAPCALNNIDQINKNNINQI